MTLASKTAMKRYQDLDELLNQIWAMVEQGSQDPYHPFHAPTFGTVSAHTPNLRTVILREVDLQQRLLLFHSDRRAQKISDIQSHSRVTWHFWDSNYNAQLRLMGKAELHFDDAIADAVWQRSYPNSLKVYLKPIAPHTEVEQPQSGLSDKAQVEEGRKHFAVIQTRIDEIDFLHLHRDGHYRAHFQWQETGVSSAWIIP